MRWGSFRGDVQEVGGDALGLFQRRCAGGRWRCVGALSEAMCRRSVAMRWGSFRGDMQGIFSWHYLGDF
jgi:hypothetical protein